MFKRNLMTLAVGAIWATSAMTAYAAPSSAGDVARDATAGLRGQLTATDTALDQMLARSKPRVPGGSGCDDPRDLIEHPECTLGNAAPAEDKMARSKPRVPGGSGCDDPRDLIEHPECTLGNAAPAEDKMARSKPRVPGGSGCDDPRDLIEHPECVIGYVVPGNELLAREASEGPRGADNERPGDRQRRGGRGHG